MISDTNSFKRVENCVEESIYVTYTTEIINLFTILVSVNPLETFSKEACSPVENYVGKNRVVFDPHNPRNNFPLE